MRLIILRHGLFGYILRLKQNLNLGLLMISKGEQFLELISQGQRWGKATFRTCFQKDTFAGIGGLCK
ncbi:hypothetical protein HRM2_08150 [Desulforapulum autotrophicum HRM2]|uniref:Uncharacterized protein n=1 Tax=Desulforapulum autotrophicum (strain ATCC 43914 / DSM 3382 / VKM B-1955 / HRM2) TaxID=177437 RepID=C0QJS5_DESAH|nr:hypothetical protein HRM2_08150 [Desulforapulum autotrophicum HRM2]